MIPPKTLSHEVQDEEAEGVWGYLVPIDTVFGDTLVLKSRSACPAPYPNSSFGKGSKDRANCATSKNYNDEEAGYEEAKRKHGFPAGGYLIGRHPECGIVSKSLNMHVLADGIMKIANSTCQPFRIAIA